MIYGFLFNSQLSGTYSPITDAYLHRLLTMLQYYWRKVKCLLVSKKKILPVLNSNGWVGKPLTALKTEKDANYDLSGFSYLNSMTLPGHCLVNFVSETMCLDSLVCLMCNTIQFYIHF